MWKLEEWCLGRNTRQCRTCTTVKLSVITMLLSLFFHSQWQSRQCLLWCRTILKAIYHLSASGPPCVGSRLLSYVEYIPLFPSSLPWCWCWEQCSILGAWPRTQNAEGVKDKVAPTLAAVMQILKRVLKSAVSTRLRCPLWYSSSVSPCYFPMR